MFQIVYKTQLNPDLSMFLFEFNKNCGNFDIDSMSKFSYKFQRFFNVDLLPKIAHWGMSPAGRIHSFPTFTKE